MAKADAMEPEVPKDSNTMEAIANEDTKAVKATPPAETRSTAKHSERGARGNKSMPTSNMESMRLVPVADPTACRSSQTHVEEAA